MIELRCRADRVPPGTAEIVPIRRPAGAHRDRGAFATDVPGVRVKRDPSAASARNAAPTQRAAA